MKSFLLCLLSTLLMAAGQTLFKLGSRGKEIHSLLDLIRLFFSPIILLALALYGCTTGLWLYILSKTPMSYAYPIQALAYPIVLLVSLLLFKEHISWTSWLGVAIIICGVAIATRG